MSVELREEAEGKVLILNLSGKLTKDDYAHFTPEVEKAVKAHGRCGCSCGCTTSTAGPSGRCGRT